MKNSCKQYNLVFVTNHVNHHQIPLADCFFEKLGDEYLYISMEPLPQWLKDGGYSEISRPYIARLDKNISLGEIQKIVDDAIIVIIGAAPHELTYNRQRQNKLTFFYSERWFKDGYYHLLSPGLWLKRYKDFIRFRNKRTYMLCASAFTSSDTQKMFCFPNKTFKWGYFTSVPQIDINAILEAHKGVSRVRILWVARFLPLKHPELAIQLASDLKRQSIKFELNMYGAGEMYETIQEQIKTLNLEDGVFLKGNLPNAQILQEMREHQIFIFTSDKNEGWGAVLNEAMSSGCAVVASDCLGAAPFLIKNGINGLLFQSENSSSLYNKVLFLIKNPDMRTQLALNAYNDMCNVWNPKNAANKFMELAYNLNKEPVNRIEEGYGPCTKA